MRRLRRSLPSIFAIAGIFLATLALTYATYQATRASQRATMAVRQIDHDTKDRIRESCVTSKTRYRAAVVSLTRTYQFLEVSNANERKSTLNKFIIAGLPKQELDLKNLRPASFCKGIGPDAPPVPKRPADLR